MIKPKYTRSIVLVFAVISLSAFANISPKESRVPGGIAKIRLHSTAETAPTVYYHGIRVMVLRTADKKDWQAIVGIPLSAKIGTHAIAIKSHKGKSKRLHFEVKRKHYKTQHLTITNKRKVNPNTKDKRVIKKQRANLNRLLAGFTQLRDINTSFAWPLKGRVSSPFGLRRFFNKQPRAPHTGLDIAAPTGTAIKAPAKGKVIATGDYFYTGKTVLLDHGQGLISLYGHLSKIETKSGQKIKRGEVLGLVGKTGRATGPHLHWGVILNGARVDPSLFLTHLEKPKKKSLVVKHKNFVMRFVDKVIHLV